VSDLRVKRGDKIVLSIAAKKADGTPQSLTGATLTFTAKDRLTDADPGVIQKTTGGGITIDDAANGLASVTILPADTSGFTGPRTLLWDVQMDVAAFGDKKTLDSGKLYVLPDVTRS
jgi:hypothetical protein